MEDVKFRKSPDLVHVSFEFGLLVKGIDGLLEVAGGILMLFLSPDRLTRLVRMLTRHELAEDPRDLAANWLLRYSVGFSVGTQYFAFFYLISHGAIKCLLMFLLWKRKWWAYPLAILSLALFIVYQMVRYFFHPSALLLVLSVFDAVMIVLTAIEYRRMRVSRREG